MDQPYISQDNQALLNSWLFQEAVDLQKQREELEREKEELQSNKDELVRLQSDLEEAKEEFQKQKKELEDLRNEIKLEKNRLENLEKSASMREEFEKQRQERSEQLFQMKWKMLEEELMKLADEKKEFEMLKNSATYATVSDNNYSVFFTGVRNELALKKRYRDLMKIFHPDNIAGDHDVVVEISKEFESMKEQFCV